MPFPSLTELLNAARDRGSLKVIKRRTILILIAMVVAFSIAAPQFGTSVNLFNIFEQNAVLGIIACGMAFMLIIGGFDLSVGSTAAFSGVVVAMLLRAYPDIFPLAVIAGLACGVAVGLANGLIISKVGINPFITTLGTMVIVRGLLIIICRGKPIYGFSMKYNVIGMGKLGPIPIPVLIWAAVVLICFVILKYTRFGQYVYAVGGNETVARLSGIKTNRTKILAAMMTGFLASLGGIVLLFRVMSALPQAATMYELYAIAAAVLGGCALGGGIGGAFGTAIGALILGVIINGLHILGISSYWEQPVTGIIILFAVSIDVISRKMASRA